MENRTIGESRARSFLIDRFWIIERSVDIHGADLLIQRRVTSVNILDRAPPRFGVIQAKFYESDGTTQHVHIPSRGTTTTFKKGRSAAISRRGIIEMRPKSLLHSKGRVIPLKLFLISSDIHGSVRAGQIERDLRRSDSPGSNNRVMVK